MQIEPMNFRSSQIRRFNGFRSPFDVNLITVANEIDRSTNLEQPALFKLRVWSNGSVDARSIMLHAI